MGCFLMASRNCGPSEQPRKGRIHCHHLMLSAIVQQWFRHRVEQSRQHFPSPCTSSWLIASATSGPCRHRMRMQNTCLTNALRRMLCSALESSNVSACEAWPRQLFMPHTPSAVGRSVLASRLVESTAPDTIASAMAIRDHRISGWAGPELLSVPSSSCLYRPHLWRV
ncbi:hypothetical protein BV20DRAFT_221794 [Pilatotrama ljubarskyi]|nr:hypothetical protein BV20DRAFT_221794 [Pilatotrama ljubarskyi]